MKTCPVCDTPYPDQHATCPTDSAVVIETRELEPGHIVRNKYRILNKLGQGGMDIVYLAEHSLLGGQVALKFQRGLANPYEQGKACDGGLAEGCTLLRGAQ